MFLTCACHPCVTRQISHRRSSAGIRFGHIYYVYRHVVIRDGIDLNLTTQLQLIEGKYAQSALWVGYRRCRNHSFEWVRHEVLAILKTDFCDDNLKTLDIDKLNKQAAC